MMTALIASFGMSACATLFIVSSVALNARSKVVEADAMSCESEYSPQAQSGKIVTAFSH